MWPPGCSRSTTKDRRRRLAIAKWQRPDLDDVALLLGGQTSIESDRDVGSTDETELATCDVGGHCIEAAVADSSKGAVLEDLEGAGGEAVDVHSADQPQVPLLCSTAPDWY